MAKKIFCLLLTLVLLSTTVIACNKKGGESTGNQPESGTSSSSESVVEPEETEGYVSLLTDKTFSNGFWMRGLGGPIYGDPIETFGDATDPNVRFQYGKENLSQPEWNICQWATRYPFHDINNTSPHLPEGKINYAFEDLGNGKYQYTNSSKSAN